MKEINYKEMKFNPFNLIGGEWMLVTAGNEQSGCNTMTASWGHLGCLWGHNDPTAVIYLRPSRYTKKFVDEEPYSQRDFHTMYVGKIEKVLVRDDEYLK
ncbi:MAG: hypothetical protein J5954_11080 [Prevotella sp.]|nr:hypothetical protein [Prevotella sp.]